VKASLNAAYLEGESENTDYREDIFNQLASYKTALTTEQKDNLKQLKAALDADALSNSEEDSPTIPGSSNV